MSRGATIARRRKLMTKRNTEAKWAGILQRAFYARPPFTEQELTTYSILHPRCLIWTKMPPSKNWGEDSSLYAFTVIEICARVESNSVDTVIIRLSMRDVGPLHHIVDPIEVETRRDWITGKEPSRATVQFMRDRVEAWAHNVIRQEVAPRRINRFKEELIAAAWAPARVERWLEAGVELEAL